MRTETNMRSRVYGAASASLFIYSSSAIALPISLVRISQELGLNLTQGGALGFITSIEQLFIMIASSFLAARFGKIRIIRTGLCILALGLALFPLSSSFLMAITLMLIIGLGNALLEALLTPLVEDLFPNDNGSKMNLLHAFWPIGTCVTVLVLGQLLSMGISWRILFVALSLIVLTIGAFFPSSKKIILPKSRGDFSHALEIFTHPRFWLFGLALAFAGGAEGAFAYWSASYIQIQFDTLPRAGAFGTAAFAVGMAVGRFASSTLAGKLGLKSLIILSLSIGLAISGGIFIINGLLVLYVFLFMMGLSVACLWPSIQSLAGIEMDVDPTPLMIFLSCFGLPGFSSATLLMGIIGDARGIQTGFIIVPLYLCLSLILILVNRSKH